jgi:PAS domain S-box-containing protein
VTFFTVRAKRAVQPQLPASDNPAMPAASGNVRDAMPSVLRTIYAVRTLSFGYTFIGIGIHLWEREAGALAWGLLVAQFLVYPHLLYLHTRAAADPRRASYAHFYADSLLLGAWTSALGFPTWIAFCLVFSSILNATINQGLRGTVGSGIALAVGGIAGMLIAGYHYAPDTSRVVTWMAIFGALAYTVGIGYVAHLRTKRLVEVRRMQQGSEERYRLIAENAGDMVMMVDRDCRLLYASPSCARLIPARDLEPGTDAFRGIHDEDWLECWSRVRATLRGGERQSFDYRMRDPGGTMRLFEAHCHAVRDAAGAACGAVLAARDVTDLRRHQAHAQLAAGAFERMAEGMMITEADGRIVMVNPAYSAVTGYASAEVVGRNEKEFRAAMQPASFYTELYAAVARDGAWKGATWSQRKDGAVYREWRTVSAVRGEEGAVSHYVTLFFEIDTPRATVRAA